MRCRFRGGGVALLVLVGGLLGADRPVAADTAAGGGLVASGGFSDVGGVHQPGIDALEAEGVFEGTGCGGGLFCPGDPIQRWVMAVWLVRVLDVEDPAGSGLSRFSDVDASSWWAPYVERLAELEVTAGCATGPLRFCPDEVVTRGQMATFLVGAFGLEESPAAGFADTGGNTHAGSIDALAAAGVTAGCATGPLRFCPGASVTRGQMATFVARAVGLVKLPDRPPDDEASPAANGFVAIDGSGLDDGRGRYSSCGVRTDGTVLCWGSNRYGQADPPDGEFVDVATTEDSTCGLRTDGTVVCWGSNRYGQADAPSGQFRDVVASPNHSCGLRTDGTVICWGYNHHGQADAPSGQFRDVAVGDDHSCGLRTDGTVICWGIGCVQTDSGSYGFGCGRYRQADPPPGRFAAVSTAGVFSCGVRSDGSIECWGVTYLQSAAHPPDGRFSDVFLGNNHACALRVDGTAVCWGNNSWGQAVAPEGRFTDLVVGGNLHNAYSCGLRTDGVVVCWGARAGGAAELGASTGTFTSVSAGDTYSCGLRTDHTLTCWGTVGKTLNISYKYLPPRGLYAEVSVGGRHACGLREDGTVVCWGYGSGSDSPPGRFSTVSAGYDFSCGVLADVIEVGVGSGGIEALPSRVTCWGSDANGRAIPPRSDGFRWFGYRHNVSAEQYTDVSAGRFHTCGLKLDGAAVCWGYNNDGQSDPPGGTFVQIAASSCSPEGNCLEITDHSCGLRENGTVQCWGYNHYGQSDPPGGKFSRVTVGDLHSCGLRVDGSIKCWGRESAVEDRQEPTKLEIPHGRFTAADTGQAHGCGIRTDATVACWGSNNSGQTDPPAGKFTRVAVGYLHSCGLGVDGSIQCWGSNSYRESDPPAGKFTDIFAAQFRSCGLRTDSTIACWGHTVRSDDPPPPAGKFTDIAMGYRHSCGLREDGAIICWGFLRDSGVPEDESAGPFVAVTAASNATCGQRGDGTITCWSYGKTYEFAADGITNLTTGVCGLRSDGTIACVDDGHVGRDVPSGQFTDAFASDDLNNLCGIREDGAIVCRGGFYQNYAAVNLTDAPEGRFTDIAAGGEHTCAVRTNGTIVCWGANKYGQAPPRLRP